MTASKTPAHTHWLRRIIQGPQFEDEDKTRTARYLNIILIVTMILLSIYAIFSLIDDLTKIVLLFMVLVMGVLLVLTWLGLVRLASLILLGVAYVGLVFQSAVGNYPLYVYDAGFAGLFILIIGAGLLVGWQAAVVMAGLNILAGFWLSRLSPEGNMLLPQGSAAEYARAISVSFTLAALLMYLLINGLRRALQRSRVSEQNLQEQNLKLLNLQTVLEDRVTARTAQLRTAAEVGQAAASILDPDELLSQVVNLITERFGFYYAAVFMPDRSNTYLVLREATGEAGRALKERGHRLRITLDSMAGYAALKRVPRVAQQTELDVTHPLLPHTQSEVTLPLLAGDAVLGVLDVQATQPNAFDETSIATLRNVAAQIAIALQNAQSYQRLQEALSYTTRQYELSRTIFTARTPGEALQALGQVFAMVSDIDRISVLQVRERDEAGLPTEYELVIEWDVLGGAQFDKGLRYAAAETPLVQLVTEDEATVIRDALDVRLPLDTRQQLAKAGVQAAVLVPLMIRGRLEGFIAAVAERSHDFQDSEVRLMKSAAEQLGVVLSNLQLTTEMQATLDRVALLNRRLSGESWNSYLTSREQWLVESGQVQLAMTTAGLQVPIVIRGETIGMFNVTDVRSDRQWQEEELTMLQTIAGEVALAIENARLIEQTQHAAQRERDIATAADKIHRSINLEAVLHTAVEEVMRIAGTTEVAIQLGRAETPPDKSQPVLAS